MKFFLVLLLLISCQEKEIVKISGKNESCLNCHQETNFLGKGHDPKIIGCSSCHLGDSNNLDKELSHRGMKIVPGNLSDAKMTCGTSKCHQEISERVFKSMMGSVRGMIAVNRYVFGESKTPNDNTSAFQLKNSDADNHLKELCIMCHLGHEKVEPSPPHDLSRGGGCTACHISYVTKDGHPQITQNVKNENCFGCHSRSSRISLSYEGFFESDTGGTRKLTDGRTLEFKEADIHFQKGLLCIDCHTSRELMGDGNKYEHQNDAIEISCEDCHTSSPKTGTWDDLSGEDRSLIFRRHKETFQSRKFIKTSKNNYYTNLFFEENKVVLEGKISKKSYYPKPLATSCTQNEHKRLACTACHTSWAPKCIGCHTQKEADGKWVEYGGTFLARPPTLGIYKNKIVPFAPGMVLTINKNGNSSNEIKKLEDEGNFHRIYAPISPHTITKNVRECASCHQDFETLGYGKGKIVGNKFIPHYEILRDGLPADAWIPYLKKRDKKSGLESTRIEARPFNILEQNRILKAKIKD